MKDETLIHLFCLVFSVLVLSSLLYALGVAQFKAAVQRMNSKWEGQFKNLK